MNKIMKVNGKEYGRIVGTTFVKNVKKSKHMLKKPVGWAIDKWVLDHAILGGVKTIKINESEQKSTYQVDVQHFQEHCFEIDRGFGTQYVLVLKEWLEISESDRYVFGGAGL